MEKSTQRKTVQWNAEQIKNVINQKEQDFRKKVLQFQAKKSHVQDSENSDSEEQQILDGKSQKTIEIQMNLKKAKINRVSQRPGQPINLKEINRRISLKENIHSIDKQNLDEGTQMKKSQFEKKRAQLCNQKFSLNKKN